MKHWLLKRICAELAANSKALENISRINDNGFWLKFNNHSFIFDLANKSIVLLHAKPKSKHYNAPIDIWLEQNCKNAKIISATVNDCDKILDINLAKQGTYKTLNFTLRFEFIPPRGSFIVLENSIVVQALRYDERIKIKKPVSLPKPPPRLPDKEPQNESTKTIHELLAFAAIDTQDKKLNELKNKKIAKITAKMSRINQILDSLDSYEQLEEASNEALKTANVIAANLNMLPSYKSKVEFLDFDGNKIIIDLFCDKSPGEWKDYFFNRAKKFKKQAQGIETRVQNLQEKLFFWQKFIEIIQNLHNEAEILSLYPSSSKRTKEADEDWHEIYFKDVKIMIGKSSVGNEKLLKLAKANDLWFHLQNIPSAHIIVKGSLGNNKQEIINYCAKLCVDFSVTTKGTYLVDFTTRKFVSPVSGSNVKYINYQTVQIVAKD